MALVVQDCSLGESRLFEAHIQRGGPALLGVSPDPCGEEPHSSLHHLRLRRHTQPLRPRSRRQGLQAVGTGHQAPADRDRGPAPRTARAPEQLDGVLLDEAGLLSEGRVGHRAWRSGRGLGEPFRARRHETRKLSAPARSHGRSLSRPPPRHPRPAARLTTPFRPPRPRSAHPHPRHPRRRPHRRRRSPPPPDRSPGRARLAGLPALRPPRRRPDLSPRLRLPRRHP